MTPLEILLFSAIGGGLGAYLGAYLREKGKNLATREDLNRIVMTTEEIKAQISGEWWIKQKRFETKLQCYLQLVEHLGELHTLISEAIALTRGPLAGQDPEAHSLEIERRRAAITERFEKFRQYGSIARIVAPAEVRTFLTAFGDEWNRSGGSAVAQGTAARNAWLGILDLARADLFGDEREIPREKKGG